MTITTTNLPKAAARLVADAKERGMEVKVQAWGSGCEVHVKRTVGERTTSVTVNWSEQNTAGVNSRLGFATDYKAGIRFDFASGMIDRGQAYQGKGRFDYPTIKSVRQARGVLGLEV